MRPFMVLLALPVAAICQSISFDAIPNQILGISPFEIAAQSDFGLPITFVSNMPAVCKVADGLVTLLSVGTCSITANQARAVVGITVINAASVTSTFTVSAANPSLIFVGAAGSPVGTGGGSAPQSVTVGDFNRDGIPDLAIPDGNASRLIVLLGNGSGGFAAATGSPFATGPGPASVAVGDFNGDGFQDLAVANSGASSVTVLLGNGAGGFTQAAGSPFATGSSPNSVAIGDFNGDGIQDLAVANFNNNNNVTVLLGSGSGGFKAASGSPFAAGSEPASVATGDFNGDGFEDLAVANFNSNNVTVLLGNGSGGFAGATGSPFAVGHAPISLAVGDFNGDGFQDLVTASQSDNDVTVLLGDGSGGFTAATGSPFAAGTTPESVAVGDFNGDGIQDLAVANLNSNNITLLLGNGTGFFTAAPDSPRAAGSGPVSVAVADFNLDGIEDLVAANANTANVVVLLGSAAGATTQTIAFGPLGSVTYGAPPFTIGATATSGLAVIFASTTPAVCTVAGNTITIVAGGMCSIVAIQTGNATYAEAETVTRSFRVIPATQTIAFGPVSDQLLGALSVPALSATATSGLPVTFSSDTPAICTVSGVTVTLVTTGECFVEGQQPGNADYDAATGVDSFNIFSPQTIAFAPLGNVAPGAPFLIAATATSGLPVIFSATTPAVCTVAAGTVSILGAGGCSITAFQPGNATFAAATPVTQRFTVLFGDVASGDYYYAAINALAQFGITSGCGNNDYCPQENVTRDDMAIFVVRAIYGGDNFTYSSTPYFSDVQPSYFAFKWIQALAALGITSGCATDMYCPGEVVTRDQMAIFIIRARLGLYLAGSPVMFTYSTTPYFTDATASDFAFPWIQRLRAENITGGCSATDYCPSQPVIRGDMAIFLMRGAFNQFLPAGTPVITQISPSTLAPGATATFTITGSNTNFVQGTTQLSPIPGVTAGAITVTSATSFTVQLTAASNATLQPYSILAITGTEQDVLPNGLVLQPVIQNPPPPP